MNGLSPSVTAQRAIDRIKAEHRTLAHILGAMQALVAEYREPGAEPDFELFGMMLRYIENVPDRLHHPKEDSVLFAAIARRTDRCTALLQELAHDHAQGSPMLAELRRAFDAFRTKGVNGLNQLSTAVDEFTEFYWTHMRKEEQQLLPVAVEVLGEEDWSDVDRTFAAHTDPLSNGGLTADYRRLYDRIAKLTPRPLKSLLEESASAA